MMFRRSGSLHSGELPTNSDYGAGVFAHKRNALTPAPSLRRLLSHSPVPANALVYENHPLPAAKVLYACLIMVTVCYSLE